MLVRYVMWDLDGSGTTIEQLREYLRDESVEAFSQVRRLRFKAWVSDAAANRWGAVTRGRTPGPRGRSFPAARGS